MFTDAHDMELTSPEVRLWRSVLLQAIEDATYRYKPVTRKKTLTAEERGEYRRRAPWLGRLPAPCRQPPANGYWAIHAIFA
jgi:hypothetical protein